MKRKILQRFLLLGVMNVSASSEVSQGGLLRQVCKMPQAVWNGFGNLRNRNKPVVVSNEDVESMPCQSVLKDQQEFLSQDSGASVSEAVESANGLSESSDSDSSILEELNTVNELSDPSVSASDPSTSASSAGVSEIIDDPFQLIDQKLSEFLAKKGLSDSDKRYIYNNVNQLLSCLTEEERLCQSFVEKGTGGTRFDTREVPQVVTKLRQARAQSNARVNTLFALTHDPFWQEVVVLNRDKAGLDVLFGFVKKMNPAYIDRISKNINLDKDDALWECFNHFVQVIKDKDRHNALSYFSNNFGLSKNTDVLCDSLSFDFNDFRFFTALIKSTFLSRFRVFLKKNSKDYSAFKKRALMRQKIFEARNIANGKRRIGLISE